MKNIKMCIVREQLNNNTISSTYLLCILYLIHNEAELLQPKYFLLNYRATIWAL